MNELSPLVLAYIGDAIYELHIRKYLISKNIVKVKELIDKNFFTLEELDIIKRARNHKSRTSKSTDIVTYKHSTALEAVIGYLYYKNNNERIEEIMKYIKGE